jgi:uncharacterized membrane protein YfcA
MGPTLINNLPAHVLIVHLVVVLVPLTAIALVASAVWPSWIRRLGLVLPLLALVTLASVPLATHAGGWLLEHTGADPLVLKHAQLGDGMWPWAAGLFVLAVALWVFGRERKGSQDAAASQEGEKARVLAVPVRIAAVVLSLAVAAGAVVQVYRVGDSGAKAAWQGNFSSQPVVGQGK